MQPYIGPLHLNHRVAGSFPARGLHFTQLYLVSYRSNKCIKFALEISISKTFLQLDLSTPKIQKSFCPFNPLVDVWSNLAKFLQLVRARSASGHLTQNCRPCVKRKTNNFSPQVRWKFEPVALGKNC
jgi:hypothetical protein